MNFTGEGIPCSHKMSWLNGSSSKNEIKKKLILQIHCTFLFTLIVGFGSVAEIRFLFNQTHFDVPQNWPHKWNGELRLWAVLSTSLRHDFHQHDSREDKLSKYLTMHCLNLVLRRELTSLTANCDSIKCSCTMLVVHWRQCPRTCTREFQWLANVYGSVEACCAQSIDLLHLHTAPFIQLA